MSKVFAWLTIFVMIAGLLAGLLDAAPTLAQEPVQEPVQEPAPDAPAGDAAIINRLWLPQVFNGGTADSTATPDNAGTADSEPAPEAAVEDAVSIEAAAAGQSSIILILKDQLDVKTIRGKDRREQRRNLVEGLRAKAIGTQVRLRARLAVLRSQGQVGAITPLWIVNGIALTASSSAINELAKAPEVDRIILDIVLQAPSVQTTATATSRAKPERDQCTGPVEPRIWGSGRCRCQHGHRRRRDASGPGADLARREQQLV